MITKCDYLNFPPRYIFYQKKTITIKLFSQQATTGEAYYKPR